MNIFLGIVQILQYYISYRRRNIITQRGGRTLDSPETVTHLRLIRMTSQLIRGYTLHSAQLSSTGSIILLQHFNVRRYGISCQFGPHPQIPHKRTYPGTDQHCHAGRDQTTNRPRLLQSQ